jgi:hypothetical protein
MKAGPKSAANPCPWPPGRERWGSPSPPSSARRTSRRRSAGARSPMRLRPVAGRPRRLGPRHKPRPRVAGRMMPRGQGRRAGTAGPDLHENVLADMRLYASWTTCGCPDWSRWASPRGTRPPACRRFSSNTPGRIPRRPGVFFHAQARLSPDEPGSSRRGIPCRPNPTTSSAAPRLRASRGRGRLPAPWGPAPRT